tara:strand:- start:372 stop:596 length:225 start_codon:yes stop_codon:yes gene_type:complete
MGSAPVGQGQGPGLSQVDLEHVQAAIGRMVDERALAIHDEAVEEDLWDALAAQDMVPGAGSRGSDTQDVGGKDD